MTVQKFKNEIDKNSRMTLNSIKKKFFMTDEDLRKEAVTHFREIVNRFNTGEEIKTGEENKFEQKKGATKYNFLK